MSRLIDADALIKAWCKKHNIKEGDYGAVFTGYSEIPRLIDEQPTVDAVEVVRCKDCKHFEYDHPYIIQGIPVLGHKVCNAWGDGCKTDENGYCFMAERRGDDS